MTKETEKEITPEQVVFTLSEPFEHPYIENQTKKLLWPIFG